MIDIFVLGDFYAPGNKFGLFTIFRLRWLFVLQHSATFNVKKLFVALIPSHFVLHGIPVNVLFLLEDTWIKVFKYH